MTIPQLFTNPYMWGIIAVLVFWAISFVITGRRLSPFALAIGTDNNYSASLLQFLIFTYLTIFAYVAVYVARLESGLTTLPTIPLNLFILMGISVISATASKGIVVSAQNNPPANTNDKGVIKDTNGNIALTKVQMLIWTFIAAGVYLITVINFIENKVYT